jgi:hypothetical protein
VLLLDLGRPDEAAEAARRVVYLDRALEMGHLLLGTALARVGDAAGARRAFRNAHALLCRRSDDEPVPLSDGQPAGRMAVDVAAHLARLPGEAAS